MFNFELLPEHIIFEIYTLIDYEQNLIFFTLNRFIWTRLVPLVYKEVSFNLLNNINIKKYGKYIQIITIPTQLDHSSINSLLDKLKHFISSKCLIRDVFLASFNLEQLEVLNTFQIKSLCYSSNNRHNGKLCNSFNIMKKLNIFRSLEDFQLEACECFMNIDIFDYIPITVKKLTLSITCPSKPTYFPNYCSNFKWLAELRLFIKNIQFNLDELLKHNYMHLIRLDIYIINVNQSYENKYAILDGKSFPKLKNIRLSFESHIALFKNEFNEVLDLDLSLLPINIKLINYDFLLFPNLTELKLSLSYNAMDTNLSNFCNSFPVSASFIPLEKLTSLTLCFIEISAYNLFFLSSCLNLNTIKLSYCTFCPALNQVFKEISGLSLSIKNIHIIACPTSNDFVKWILNTSLGLKTIYSDNSNLKEYIMRYPSVNFVY